MKQVYKFGEAIQWDVNYVPLNKQPRPYFGIFEGLYHNGATIRLNRGDMGTHNFSFAVLEKLGIFLQDVKNPCRECGVELHYDDDECLNENCTHYMHEGMGIY